MNNTDYVADALAAAEAGLADAQGKTFPSPPPVPSPDPQLEAIVAAMDRHTAAVNRMADQFERLAEAAIHFNEQTFHATR
jgi:hypothetical protein